MSVLVCCSAVRAAEPHLVADINPGPDPEAYSYPGDFVRLGNHVLFSADDDVHGRELWRTDGTETGTVLVADIAPGRGWSYAAELTRLRLRPTRLVPEVVG